MRILKYSTITLLVLLAVFASAQDTGLHWTQLNKNSNRIAGKLTGETYYMTSLSNNNFFLQKDWVNAQITLEDGDVFNDVKVRYLAYGDELIAYNKNLKLLYKLDKKKIKLFTFSDEKYTHKFVKLVYVGIFSGPRYFELLYSGTQQLLLFYHIEAVRVSPFVDKSGKMQDTQYKLLKTYYMYSLGSGFTKMQFRRRSFIKAFPDRKKKIRKVFRKNKINILNQTALIQSFTLLEKEGLLKK